MIHSIWYVEDYAPCQSTPVRKRLPITIDILKNLKSQLRLCNYTVGEQRMLW